MWRWQILWRCAPRMLGCGCAQEGQGKEAVQPNPARSDGPPADFVAIPALVRAEWFERAAVSHQAELAVAMGATVVHDALLIHQLDRAWCGYGMLYCTATINIAMHNKYETRAVFPASSPLPRRDKAGGCIARQGSGAERRSVGRNVITAPW